MIINTELQLLNLQQDLKKFWPLSGEKILLIEEKYVKTMGAPVFTWAGKYIPTNWTEWTQGFQFGSAIIQYDATGNEDFLTLGRKQTIDYMAPHISHIGVHDHGFNNISTYGNLLRLMNENKIQGNEFERNFYELALKVSGAVQASRWTNTADGGYMYSFNGPHSLFVDTIRTCRSLMVSHRLGHSLMGENDCKINLLHRALEHLKSTAKYSIYYDENRDSYDEEGRTAHECIFNTNDGSFRCPNTQQGFSGFTTWTRGLAWAMLGFPEQLEFLKTLNDKELEPFGGFKKLEALFLKAAKATCNWFIKNTPTDGIPYWDGGAPNLQKLENYLNKPADPFNDWEPVDSSAAAIGAQGLLRLGEYLGIDTKEGANYWQAGLTVTKTLLNDTYMSLNKNHQGLLLHSVYHQPNGWDYKPKGSKIPYGESCMWGDYHIRELALYINRKLNKELTYYYFS